MQRIVTSMKSGVNIDVKLCNIKEAYEQVSVRPLASAWSGADEPMSVEDLLLLLLLYYYLTTTILLLYSHTILLLLLLLLLA